MTKVVIKAKELQRVQQAAKDLHTRNAEVHISKGTLIFSISGDGKKVIKLEEVAKNVSVC